MARFTHCSKPKVKNWLGSFVTYFLWHFLWHSVETWAERWQEAINNQPLSPRQNSSYISLLPKINPHNNSLSNGSKTTLLGPTANHFPSAAHSTPLSGISSLCLIFPSFDLTLPLSHFQLKVSYNRDLCLVCTFQKLCKVMCKAKQPFSDLRQIHDTSD